MVTTRSTSDWLGATGVRRSEMIALEAAIWCSTDAVTLLR